MRKPSVRRKSAPREKRARELTKYDGKPAIAQFLRVAAEQFDGGGEAALRQWVTQAFRQLQQDDQTELVAILLGFSFEARGSL